MTLTDVEQRFLARQPLGHLATIGPDGTPQVKPLGFTYNAALGTIDIAGFNMAGSAKYRNIPANPRVAFVVDEVTEASMEGAHFLEIRGTAEAVTGERLGRRPPGGGDHPHPSAAGHRLQRRSRRPGLQTRDVAAGDVQPNVA